MFKKEYRIEKVDRGDWGIRYHIQYRSIWTLYAWKYYTVPVYCFDGGWNEKWVGEHEFEAINKVKQLMNPTANSTKNNRTYIYNIKETKNEHNNL